VTTSENIGEKD